MFLEMGDGVVRCALIYDLTRKLFENPHSEDERVDCMREDEGASGAGGQRGGVS